MVSLDRLTIDVGSVGTLIGYPPSIHPPLKHTVYPTDAFGGKGDIASVRPTEATTTCNVHTIVLAVRSPCPSENKRRRVVPGCHTALLFHLNKRQKKREAKKLVNDDGFFSGLPARHRFTKAKVSKRVINMLIRKQDGQEPA